MTLSNDDIYNGIIKKENGVNPFLTVMNYKISFKTWIKYAKRRIKKKSEVKEFNDGEHNDGSTSHLDEDAKPKYCEVEIDVEEFFSETSEEDDPGEAQLPGSYSKK